MNYKYLVSSDLDGTLLCRGEMLSEENLAAIKEMKERGICFVPNSGRSFSTMPKKVIENPHIRYYIGADGSSIWDKETGEYFGFPMSAADAKKAFDLLAEYSVLISFSYRGKVYIDSAKANAESYAKYRVSKNYGLYIDYYHNKIEGFDEFAHSCDEIEMIVVAFENDDEQKKATDALNALGIFHVSSSEATNIEIVNANAGKGSALLALAEKLSIPKENTVAVGDSKNDMDMIKEFRSYAMENGVTEIKCLADGIVSDVKDVIFKELEEL